MINDNIMPGSYYAVLNPILPGLPGNLTWQYNVTFMSKLLFTPNEPST